MSFIYMDAGISHIKIKTQDKYFEIVNNDNINVLINQNNLLELIKHSEVFISGKLAKIFQKHLKSGTIIESSAAFWARAKENNNSTQGIIDISASGYMVICVDGKGKLVKDLLISNPKCGAGTGINLMRILQKLDLNVDDVDILLKRYIGSIGEQQRLAIPVRADRCGVFASSATISDKNQGIPLDHALAVTIKSEVLKACKKLIPNTNTVLLTGGVFLWQFAKDCATDYLKQQGVKNIIHKKYCLIEGMQNIKNELKSKIKKPQLNKLRKKQELLEYPNFNELRNRYEPRQIFKRLNESAITTTDDLSQIPINMSFDVGSTMAKIAIENANSKELLYINSFENNGDTIETIKDIFKSLNVDQLNIQQIGITGSGRYQVKTILGQTFPSLKGNIFVLVENYAHARGSIDLVKSYLNDLPSKVNKEFCVLVDIGGEDTKLSTISLDKEELFDNVMNIKCSAGTGSLMDTLKAMFGIKEISKATQMAFDSKKAYEINATCAVFLMENAKKMQIEGYGKDEILASCNFAIVENMARTLWNQIELPKNAVVLLHGQTMLSDPLPLAVTHRIQDTGDMYCLVPPHPGHRACIGLLKSLEKKEIVDNYCNLNIFINQTFIKKIIICHGVACGDKNAKCSRTLLTSNTDNSKIMLGGCTAVNELMAQTKNSNNITIDAYGDIWNFIDANMPHSNDKNRLIIPRMFAVSEYAFLLAKIFEHLGIPVHVDAVQEQDILSAQSNFSVDVCAPFIGATGQISRLAKEPHGVIFLPQLDFLPTENESLGRTCTTNQGGAVIARNLAELENVNANFVEFDLSLQFINTKEIVNQLIRKITPITNHYNIPITVELLSNAVAKALLDEENNRILVAEKAADYIEQAIEHKRNISIVCAREYILTPGVYDSHVGRLLKDKHVVAIPSYALRTKLDGDFKHIYWKNPHDILTKVKAVANKSLHKIMIDEKPKNLIKQIETNSTNSLISTTQVSTFRCGPDSVTVPTSVEITKNTPSLFIQSDGMIKELAHLENRVNTHINQLNKRLHENIEFKEIDFKLINDFGINKINKKTDVVYIPTLHDNIAVTAVLRSSGITTIDNFDEDNYNLEKISKLGRKYAGDSICVPLASVFGDIVLAREDFLRRKKENDPLVKDKTRIVVFDSKGTGPCRQGQYFELHKLLAAKYFSDNFTKLVVAHESENYNIGLEEWTLVQSYHGLIIKGVLNSLYLKAGSSVEDYEEFEIFNEEFKKLKKQIYYLLEAKTKPNSILTHMIKHSKDNLFSAVLKYFIYGLYNNNGIPKILKNFSNKWVKEFDKKISIHVEGELFVRSAQVVEIFKSIIDTIGFRSAEITYSPIWSYIEIILEEDISFLKEEINNLSIDNANNQKKINSKQKEINNKHLVIKNLRTKIAKPLYDAAKIDFPDNVKDILINASKIFPTLKPLGELIPFTGEAIHKLKTTNVDLLFNVSPEGCMVASMGQVISPKILHLTKKGRIENLSTLNGELDEDKIMISLLKCLGPIKFYSK